MTATALDVRDAIARVTRAIAPLGTERIARADARGRVLAEAVRSPVALPPWRNSAMDGYAVRAADLAALPARLRVIETVAAGAIPTRSVGPGEATRIMTGAPVPEGADTVVRVEDTDAGTTAVEIRDARDAGKNVRPRGEDIAEGASPVAAGTELGPAQLGVLASIGAEALTVFREPRVGILSSGDELIEPGDFSEVAAGRKIVSSNSVTLHELVREAGGVPVNLGIAADTRDSLREHLARSADCDLLITSGGISVGEFDYVREVLAELGATLDFWRVRMRPGAPIGFGALAAQGGAPAMPWLGLPGNPVSTMVTFELFARPAIRKMRGHTMFHRRAIPVRVAEDVRVGVELTHYLRARVSEGEDGVFEARLTGPQSSGMLTSMSSADALLILPRGVMEITAGTMARAIPLGSAARFGAAPV
ncbi:MAG: molybdopterin molybdotransferase MoeA [Gemmatimonadetes bacterium]|nr:molybdopterin molybdotransferase MoeA [Gemmatimonadota bacterium]